MKHLIFCLFLSSGTVLSIFADAHANSSSFIQNCGVEIYKFCAQVEPGNGRVFECLVDKKDEVGFGSSCQLDLERMEKWLPRAGGKQAGFFDFSRERFFGLLFGFVAFSLLFVLLESLRPSVRGQKLWRKGYLTDTVYWVVTPLITRSLSKMVLGALAVFLIVLFGINEINPILLGFGPLARQPIWLQAVEIIVAADFIGYWLHRAFHTKYLWKFHAIHHSSEELDWLSSVRLHPVNDIVSRSLQVLPLLFIGLSPLTVSLYLPFLTFHSIFIHANVAFSFGPFRKVISSPIFHRWHHTKENEALDKNFAGLFPVWDILFGTFYFPDNKVPSQFGTLEQVPKSFWKQLFYPFVRAREVSSNDEKHSFSGR